MYLLISTENTTHFSVALGEDKILSVKTVKRAFKHAEFLLRTIDALVKSQKLKVKSFGSDQLNAIFVVNGPGGFSATRIGVATANAMAYALNVPVIGVKIEEEWMELSEKKKLEKVWERAVDELKVKSQKSKVMEENFSFVTPYYNAEPHITVKKS